MIINVSKWSKRLHLTVREVACLDNHIDPDFHNTNTYCYTSKIPWSISEAEKDFIAFIGSDANEDGYMASRNLINDWFEYMDKTCPDVLQPFKNSKQNLKTKDSSAQNKTSAIDLKRLDCLGKLILRWEVDNEITFEIDSDYKKAKRKIIPISSNIMLKALKKEFNNNNLKKLAASKLENTSFWKAPERKDICILSKTNSRNTELEKIISKR